MNPLAPPCVIEVKSTSVWGENGSDFVHNSDKERRAARLHCTGCTALRGTSRMKSGHFKKARKHNLDHLLVNHKQICQSYSFTHTHAPAVHHASDSNPVTQRTQVNKKNLTCDFF